MALVVEDGTGKADAESYISVVDASTYHTARGNAAWAALASDTVRETYLRRATDYMTQAYRLRWKGYRVTSTQALDWPRAMVERPDYAYTGANGYTTISGAYYFPSNAVPVEVARACAELALRAISGPLADDLGQKVLREKVGPIETQYAEGARATVTYTAIDNILAPFLKQIGMFLRVERA